MRRLCTMIGRYGGESLCLKEYMAELIGEIIKLLENVRILKGEAIDIKEEALRSKVEWVVSQRELA